MDWSPHTDVLPRSTWGSSDITLGLRDGVGGVPSFPSLPESAWAQTTFPPVQSALIKYASPRPFRLAPVTNLTSDICTHSNLSWTALLTLFNWITPTCLSRVSPTSLHCEDFLGFTTSPNPDEHGASLLCTFPSRSIRVSPCQWVSPPTVVPSDWSAGPPSTFCLVNSPASSKLPLWVYSSGKPVLTCASPQDSKFLCTTLYGF